MIVLVIRQTRMRSLCNLGRKQGFERKSMDRAALVRALGRIVGPGGVSDAAHDQLVYEYDASFDTHPPTLIVWPTSTAQVAEVARLANVVGLPVVARGAGTGLAGGSVPTRGGIVVSGKLYIGQTIIVHAETDA